MEIPSLYGCFPETLYTALQGSVAEVDLNKAQSRAAAEYAKIHVRDLIGNATEADFQWAISVRALSMHSLFCWSSIPVCRVLLEQLMHAELGARWCTQEHSQCQGSRMGWM